MKHVMIDIETMGSQTKAAVISIGLAEFIPAENKIGRTLEVRNTFEAQRVVNRVFDPSTVEWWMQQDKAAQEQLFVEPVLESAREMMVQVNQFLGNICNSKWKLALWAKAPTFDLNLLRSLSEDVTVAWPGHYSREYCVRTMLAVAKANGWTDILQMQATIKHGALSDAVLQAEQVMEVMKRVKQ